MLKTLFIAVGFLALGFFGYQLVFLSNTQPDKIPLGLWIESSRNSNLDIIAKELFILEKLPDKDLILLSQLSEQGKNRFYPITTGEDLSISAALNPDLPCNVTIVPGMNKLHCHFSCSSMRKLSVTFIQTNDSIFNNKEINKNISQDEIETLEGVSKIEALNKDIHSLKSKLRIITTNMKAGNVDELISKLLNGKLEKFNKNNETVSVSAIKEKLDEVENNRKNILRVSNYGSEVELASRINNIEWQSALKHWNSNIEQSNLSPPSDQNSLNIDNNIQGTTPDNPPIKPNSNTNDNKSGEWWKEF